MAKDDITASEITVAVSSLTGPLVEVYDQLLKLRSDVDKRCLQANFKIARILCEVEAAKERYGADGLTQLTTALGISASNARLYRQVGRAITQKEFNEAKYIDVVSKGGMRFQWSHLVVLSRLATQEERGQYVQQFIDEGLTSNDLQQRVTLHEQHRKQLEYQAKAEQLAVEQRAIEATASEDRKARQANERFDKPAPVAAKNGAAVTGTAAQVHEVADTVGGGKPSLAVSPVTKLNPLLMLRKVLKTATALDNQLSEIDGLSIETLNNMRLAEDAVQLVGQCHTRLDLIAKKARSLANLLHEASFKTAEPAEDRDEASFVPPAIAAPPANNPIAGVRPVAAKPTNGKASAAKPPVVGLPPRTVKATAALPARKPVETGKTAVAALPGKATKRPSLPKGEEDPDLVPIHRAGKSPEKVTAKKSAKKSAPKKATAKR